MVTDDIIVQSIPVKLHCENDLYHGLNIFFNSLCPGDSQVAANPLNMVLTFQSHPPQLPEKAKLTVETPAAKCHRLGHYYYYTTDDGSMVQFDPASRHCHGYIRPELQNDFSVICSLVSGPLIDTMKAEGRFYLHAAALSHNGIGYLISGDGGSGKTTSALNLVRSGFDYVSDDSLIVDNREGFIRVSPWYHDFHVESDTCRRYAELWHFADISLGEGEKHSIDISRYFKGRPKKWIEPSVILFPRISAQKNSMLSPLKSMEMFSRLLKQIFLGSDPVVAERQLEIIKMLAQTTCGYELISGEDLLEDPEKLSSLITNITVRQ